MGGRLCDACAGFEGGRRWGYLRRWSILGCLWEGVCAMPAQVLKQARGGRGGWWRGARGDAEEGGGDHALLKTRTHHREWWE